jgi:hypothetical protein
MHNELKGKLVTQKFHFFESGCYHINSCICLGTQSEHSWIFVLFVLPWHPWPIWSFLWVGYTCIRLFLFTSPLVISYSISIMARGAFCFMGGVFLGVPLLPFTHLGTSFQISQQWMKQKNMFLRCLWLYKSSAFWNASSKETPLLFKVSIVE